MDSKQAWDFLCEHPVFKDNFKSALDIDVVKVNPKTKCIEDDEVKNTLINIWLECGPVNCVKDTGGHLCATFSHDIDLDCGGDTFEEAIVELAKLVRKKYGKKQINWNNKKETDNLPLCHFMCRAVIGKGLG